MATPPPQGTAHPYPGGYWTAGPEAALRKRVIWLLNAVGLGGLYIGFLISLTGTADTIVLNVARFFAFSGGLLAVLVSLAGALASKRTTDIQNLGLFLWSGLLLVGTVFVVQMI